MNKELNNYRIELQQQALKDNDILYTEGIADGFRAAVKIFDKYHQWMDGGNWVGTIDVKSLTYEHLFDYWIKNVFLAKKSA